MLVCGPAKIYSICDMTRFTFRMDVEGCDSVNVVYNEVSLSTSGSHLKLCTKTHPSCVLKKIIISAKCHDNIFYIHSYLCLRDTISLGHIIQKNNVYLNSRGIV